MRISVYLERFGSEQLIMAGPFLSETGDMIGSMLILDFESVEAAKGVLCSKDPEYPKSAKACSQKWTDKALEASATRSTD